MTARSSRNESRWTCFFFGERQREGFKAFLIKFLFISQAFSCCSRLSFSGCEQPLESLCCYYLPKEISDTGAARPARRLKCRPIPVSAVFQTAGTWQNSLFPLPTWSHLTRRTEFLRSNLYLEVTFERAFLSLRKHHLGRCFFFFYV